MQRFGRSDNGFVRQSMRTIRLTGRIKELMAGTPFRSIHSTTLGFMVAMLVLGVSCATTPPRAENKAFADQTGTSLVFIKRGVFSVALEYRDDAVGRLSDMLMGNNVVLVVDDTISGRATIHDDGQTITVRVRDVMSGWDANSRNVYMVALLSTIAGLAAATPSGGPESVGMSTVPDATLFMERFNNVVHLYASSGYQMPGLMADR